MKKTLFIGDSHTCGYDSVPGKTGQGSYSIWNDNNYADQYALLHNKPSIIYAMSGATNTAYKDWLMSTIKENDIDEVFLLLAPLNRFIIAYDKSLGETIIQPNHFRLHHGSKHNGLVDIYYDDVVKDNAFQLFNKPHSGDYNFPGLGFSYEDGLTDPNIRKSTFMEVKTFFDLNTHLEYRQLFQDIYTWDNICHDADVKLFIFNMTERSQLPKYNNYYGELKATKISDVSVETYFSKKYVDHKKYYTADNEHYNTEYHKMIAGDFLHWLKTY